MGSWMRLETMKRQGQWQFQNIFFLLYVRRHGQWSPMLDEIWGIYAMASTEHMRRGPYVSTGPIE